MKAVLKEIAEKVKALEDRVDHSANGELTANNIIDLFAIISLTTRLLDSIVSETDVTKLLLTEQAKTSQEAKTLLKVLWILGLTIQSSFLTVAIYGYTVVAEVRDMVHQQNVMIPYLEKRIDNLPYLFNHKNPIP